MKWRIEIFYCFVDLFDRYTLIAKNKTSYYLACDALTCLFIACANEEDNFNSCTKIYEIIAKDLIGENNKTKEKDEAEYKLLISNKKIRQIEILKKLDWRVNNTNGIIDILVFISNKLSLKDSKLHKVILDLISLTFKDLYFYQFTYTERITACVFTVLELLSIKKIQFTKIKVILQCNTTRYENCLSRVCLIAEETLSCNETKCSIKKEFRSSINELSLLNKK